MSFHPKENCFHKNKTSTQRDTKCRPNEDLKGIVCQKQSSAKSLNTVHMFYMLENSVVADLF